MEKNRQMDDGMNAMACVRSSIRKECRFREQSEASGLRPKRCISQNSPGVDEKLIEIQNKGVIGKDNTNGKLLYSLNFLAFLS